MIKISFILLIIWLLIGLITAWRLYHGMLKSWYEEHGESFHDSDKAEAFLLKVLTVFCSPIIVAGGLFSFIGFNCRILVKTPQAWWFTTKGK